MEKPKNNKTPGWKSILGAVGLAAVAGGANQAVEGYQDYRHERASNFDQRGLTAKGTITSMGEPTETIVVRSYKSSHKSVGDERAGTELFVQVEVSFNGIKREVFLPVEEVQGYHVGDAVVVTYSEFADVNAPQDKTKADTQIDSLSPLLAQENNAIH